MSKIHKQWTASTTDSRWDCGRITNCERHLLGAFQQIANGTMQNVRIRNGDFIPESIAASTGIHVEAVSTGHLTVPEWHLFTISRTTADGAMLAITIQDSMPIQVETSTGTIIRLAAGRPASCNTTIANQVVLSCANGPRLRVMPLVHASSQAQTIQIWYAGTWVNVKDLWGSCSALNVPDPVAAELEQVLYFYTTEGAAYGRRLSMERSDVESQLRCRAQSAWTTYDPRIRPLPAYVHCVLRNEVATLGRLAKAQKRRLPKGRAVISIDGQDPMDTQRDFTRDIALPADTQATLNELSSTDRDICKPLMHDTVAGVARGLNVSRGTVKGARERARKVFQNRRLSAS